MRDPKTAECPIALALKKEDAAWLYQFGNRVGDVVCFLRLTYSVPLRHQLDPSPEVFGGSEVRYDTGSRCLLSAHGDAWPLLRCVGVDHQRTWREERLASEQLNVVEAGRQVDQ